MKIIEATITPLKIPFTESFSHSTKSRTYSDSIVVKLKAADGTIGYGEAVARPYVTGETVESCLQFMASTIWEHIKHIDYPEPEPDISWLYKISETIPTAKSQGVIAFNAAKAGFELALLDCLLKSQNLSLSTILPPKRNTVIYSGAITSSSIEKAVKNAKSFKLFGLKHIKVKVTGEEDFSRLHERYFAIACFAFRRQVSYISTPNPSTLLRLAEVANTYKQDIIRAIHDGTFGNKSIKPQPKRAKELDKIADRTNALLPKDCWRHLQLIGCWTGGTVGIQAQKLANYYGAVPIRDIGYLASEARITLPYQDNTPSGILALTTNYYEFIPEEELDSDNPTILLSHEIELGKRYGILLTTTAGLYRYQIHDIVEVTGFYRKAPLLAFIRKSQDMTNITGEKMHVNHILMAMEIIRQKYNLPIVTYRFTPDIENQRYKIYLELDLQLTQTIQENLLQQIITAIDLQLCHINCEYEQKRQSKRLHLPCLYIMPPGWSEAEIRKEIANNKRNVQYKWKIICHENG
ncbi:hypothetical protein RIVM261_007900 [Rivularia sp. IAM M-261]|nr:hypothetical protein RIVM261_007900 [Rivularia sp. IAM M-261]